MDEIEIHVEDCVATVRLNRPDFQNRFNEAIMVALRDAALELRDRTDVHTVVLTGSTEFFSAGADLSLAQQSSAPSTLLETRQAVRLGPDMCEAWERLEQVTIAAIEGYCIGGGAALVLACDFRIAGAGARIRLPEVPLGINMSWRSLPRLAALVGPSKAKRISILGESIKARQALDWGLIDEAVDEGDALNTAQTLANRIASLPPLSVRMTKEAINACVNTHHFAASQMDRDQFLLTLGSADFKEGISAYFEKRPPKFKGN
ncbi:MAG: enoyl-CoA hydratase/isomerase family protein [Pseudomonadota bacterium]